MQEKCHIESKCFFVAETSNRSGPVLGWEKEDYHVSMQTLYAENLPPQSLLTRAHM